MKNVLLWVRDNMAVALLLVAASTIAAGLYQAGEADTIDYNYLAAAYAPAAPATKASIRAAMADGKLSRWEAKGLLQNMMLQKGGVVMTRAPVAPIEETRAHLIRELEQ